MITDIFALRCKNLHFIEYDTEQTIGRAIVQAGHIFFEDVQPVFKLQDDFFRRVNNKLARELGLPTLKEYLLSTNEQEICRAFLMEAYKEHAKLHANPDYYCKTRLSMPQHRRLPRKMGGRTADFHIHEAAQSSQTRRRKHPTRPSLT